MKKSFYPLAFGAKLIVGGLLATSLLSPQTANAQQATERVYATSQTTGGSLLTTTSAPTNAVDGDPLTASTLNLPVGVGGLLNRHQTLSFASARPANSTTYVKIGTETGLVAVGNTVTLQAYNGNSAVGSPVSVPNLANLLNGGNDIEVSITPSASYTGVRVTLGTTVLGLVSSLSVYEAYYVENATSTIACGTPIDNLNGVATLGVASFTGSVANPLNAYDDDDATYATLNSGVANVAGYVQETVVFPGTAATGDEVRVLLSTPAALLNIDLLASLTVITYDGATVVDEYGDGAGLLNITLLSGSSNTAWATFSASAPFDRIQVRLGGVGSVLTQLRVHEIQRAIPAPTVTALQADIYAYEGNDANLTATLSNASDNLVWFDAPLGGSAVTSPLNTDNQGGNTITVYAAAERNGCTDESDRAEVNVHVVDFTNESPDNGTVNIAYNSSVAVNPPVSSSLPNTPDYSYTLVTGSLPTGITLNPDGTLSGTPTVDGSFPISIAVDDVANNIPVGTFNYNITIDDVPMPLNWAGFSAKVSDNQAVVLNWETRDEVDNSHFVLEKSYDGKNFDGFAKVGAKNQMVNDYTYTDAKPGQNAVYYRIQQVDIDGKSSYSRTVSVNIGNIANSDAFNIVPNPSVGQVTVQIAANSNVSQVVITDLSGKVVANQSATHSTVQLNLAPGIYLVNAIDAAGNKISTQKAVVR